MEMKSNFAVLTTLVILGTAASQAQPPVEGTETVPIYRVTVVERTLRAVNYQYRTGSTKVDFRGTVLLPDAKGEATVESKRARIFNVRTLGDHASRPCPKFGRSHRRRLQ
jgi:hypothetical protein